jgi:hypothetical protein
VLRARIVRAARFEISATAFGAAIETGEWCRIQQEEFRRWKSRAA